MAFVGLFTESDDEGRLPGSAKRLAGVLFPFDADIDANSVDRLLSELETAGCIVRYEAQGGSYIAIPQWAAHQVISHPTRSTIPAPRAASGRGKGGEVRSGVSPERLRKDSGAAPERLRNASGIPPERLRKDSAALRKNSAGNGREGKGREGKGSEREGPVGKQDSPTSAHTVPVSALQVLRDVDWGPVLVAKFPALDGQGPRPHLVGEVASDLGSFRRKFAAEGRDAAYHGLVSWISRRYGPHEAGWRRSGGVDVSALGSRAPEGS